MIFLESYCKSYLWPVGWPRFLAAVLISAVFWYYFLWKYQRATVLRVVLCALYTAVVLTITLLSRTDGMIESTPDLFFATWQGLFVKKDPGNLYELFYNTLLFVPLGFIFADCGFTKKKAVLFAFLVSLGIETLQLLTGRGVLEICDIVHNTLGGYLGVLFYRFFMQRKEKMLSN